MHPDAVSRLACLQATDGRMTMSTHTAGVLPRCPTPWTRPPCQAETHKERSSSSRLSFLFCSETNACHFCWQHFFKPTSQHFVGSKLTEAHHHHVTSKDHHQTSPQLHQSHLQETISQLSSPYASTGPMGSNHIIQGLHHQQGGSISTITINHH